MRASTAAFADSINTGFYVNSYTTKQCPTMEGVLENLRQGLERLEDQRAQEEEELKRKRARDEAALGRELSEAEQKAYKGKSPFAETMRTINRLSSSYRRCYWKSGAEMIFPILYGHMTFASHRCWTVYVKKGVFQAAQAWRRVYGRSIRHAAIRAGGGEIIQHLRQGMDPYPLQGWRWIEVDGQSLLEGPLGQRCETTAEAFDAELASQGGAGGKELSAQLTMIQKFLNQCCSETKEVTGGGAAAERDDEEDTHVRQAVTTSALEDWLWRGDHPIVKDMHWYVYSMWVYRVEKMPLKLKDNGEPMEPEPRFIDIEFSPDYKLHHTH